MCIWYWNNVHLDNLRSYFNMLTSYTLYMYRFTLQQSANTGSLRINDEVLPHWHLIHKYIHCYQDVSDFTYSGYIPKQTPELLFYFNRDLFLKWKKISPFNPRNSTLHILEGKGFCYVADNVTYVNANRHETGLRSFLFRNGCCQRKIVHMSKWNKINW